MTTPAPDAQPLPEADAIVAALSRIRGRRGGRGGHDGRGGSPWGGPGGGAGGHDWQRQHDGAEHPGARGDHSPRDYDPSRHGPRGQDPRGHGGHRRGWPGERGWPGAHGGRERFGGPALLRLLSALSHASEPLTVSVIAERVGVDQPRASRLVQQAVAQGFAEREADPEDARRTRVRLTEAGESAVHGFRGRQREDVSEALTALEAEERAELARLLTKLADAWPEH